MIKTNRRPSLCCIHFGIVVSIVLMASRAIDALTCYDCDSISVQSGCVNPSAASGTKTCTSDQCFYYETQDGEVVRTCYTDGDPIEACADVEVYGEAVEGCLCDTDYCNGAPLSRPTPAVFSTSVNCYNCSSDVQPDCVNPMNATDITTCNTGNQCFYYTSIDDVTGVEIMARVCYQNDNPIDGCSTLTIEGELVDGCFCSTDYCNGGQLQPKTLQPLQTGKPILPSKPEQTTLPMEPSRRTDHTTRHMETGQPPPGPPDQPPPSGQPPPGPPDQPPPSGQPPPYYAHELITCYECVSTANFGCLFPGGSSGISTCSTRDQCITYVTAGGALGKAIVTRSCVTYDSDYPMDDCRFVMVAEGTVFACLCSHDYCNTYTANSMNGLLVANRSTPTRDRPGSLALMLALAITIAAKIIWID